MWLIAAGIIGLIVYLSAIERIRDFAVFKATGAPTRGHRGRPHAPGRDRRARRRRSSRSECRSSSGSGLPFPSELGAAGIVQLVVISLVVGVLASLAGVRRALGTDPAVAFGGK